jgi:hypothetical protein
MGAAKIRTSADIAKRNDLFRSCMIPAPTLKVILTEIVAESPNREDIITAVRAYKFASEDDGNNPHGENDFGKVVVKGTDYFFKFDYYAVGLQYGADPYTERNVVHVLTIMEASEY